MSSAQHTAGPWSYGEDQRGRMRVFDTDGHEVVRALSISGLSKRPLAEREANARLIAAAPDLLASLDEVTLLLSNVGRGDRIATAVMRARRAIAKTGAA